MTKIKINNIKIFGFHGIYEEEIKEGQFFILNVEYKPITSLDNSLFISNDSIDNVIDYVDIVKKIESCFNTRRFNLIESLAKYLISEIKEHFEFDYIKISIQKNFSNSGKDINATSIEIEEIFRNE